MRVVPVVGIAVCLLLLFGAPTPAQGSFKGSPGKVAYITGPDPQPLKLWDPADAALSPDDPQAGVVTLTGTTYALPTQDTLSLGAASTPVWSPDGTRIAYVKSIIGTGNSPIPVKHTAIFLYDLRDGASHQLTFPIDTLADLDGPDPTFIEHSAADWSPTWSNDGQTIAFIRQFIVTPDDTQYIGQAGQNLWTVSAEGGSPTRKTAYGQEPPYPTNGAVWIPGTNNVLVAFFSNADLNLVRQPLAAGGATTVSTEFMTDYDVSPDGTQFAYTSLGAGGIAGFSGDIADGIVSGQGTWDSTLLRFSNSGDGLLRTSCLPRPEGPPACGVVDRMFDDPTADIHTGEKDRFALNWRDRQGVFGNGAVPGRVLWDVQPQTLPVIFVPGFLGSKISCADREYWPDLPFPDLLGMGLTSDGLSNSNCAASAPTGDVLETALGSDVYKTVADYVRSRFDNGRGTLFGWDWRKDPKESFDRLSTAINDALARPGPWKDQDAGRVVLWGHSYGGLLIRDYISDSFRGADVARVLTAGTPYWGSPKAFFPLAFGIESPVFSPMDLFINNDRMKQFARNLAGLYNLYPSDHHPGWLSVDGAAQDQSGVSAFIGSIGGNQALFANARANHTNRFDGFHDAGGQIDVRVVVGTGVETVSTVQITHEPNGIFVTGSFGNGDGTVPGISGAQGPLGTTTPLGDPVHIAYQCNVKHVPLPGDGPVIGAYDEFLDIGRVPRKLPGPCDASGGTYDFDAATIGSVPEPLRASRTGRLAALADAPLSLNNAQDANLIDFIEAPPAAIAVVDDDQPVTLRVKITGGRFSYTPLHNNTAGTRLTYGPLTGTLDLAPGSPGGPPIVTLDGRLVTPNAPPPTPAPVITPTGPVPPGVNTTPPGSALGPALRRLAISGRPRLHDRTLKVRVVVPGAGTVRAVVRRKNGKRPALGAARFTSERAQTRTLTVRLRVRPGAPVRLTITYTPVKGTAQNVSTSVRPR